MKYTGIAIILIVFLCCCNRRPDPDIYYSNSICKCLDSLKETGGTDHNFRICFASTLDRHSSESEQEPQNSSGDRSRENAYKFSEELGLQVSIDLIGSCTIYFKFIDSLKQQQYSSLNKDSLRALLKRLDSVAITKKNKQYYEQACILYFQLGNYDKALENAENALSDNPADVLGIFVKASINDIKGNYKEAIILYDQAAKLSHQSAYYMYSALARRKKSSL